LSHHPPHRQRHYLERGECSLQVLRLSLGTLFHKLISIIEKSEDKICRLPVAAAGRNFSRSTLRPLLVTAVTVVVAMPNQWFVGTNMVVVIPISKLNC